MFRKVVGGDTNQGGLPWLVSPPATDNFKCTCSYYVVSKYTFLNHASKNPALYFILVSLLSPLIPFH
jgi:hypothetical protein